MTTHDVPDAELMIATGCAHCPVVLAGLAELLKEGQIGRLTVTNVATHPEVAAARGVRGVPWMRIGPFELTGLHRQDALARWVERARSDEGMRAYLSEGLASGELESVTSACRRSPSLLPRLIEMAGDLETPFAVRIGAGAVLEDLGPDGLLKESVEDFARLAASPLPQVRADAAHFLGLSGSSAAQTLLRQLAGDDDPEVREIAAESLSQWGRRSENATPGAR
jgi:hypothetical protein